MTLVTVARAALEDRRRMLLAASFSLLSPSEPTVNRHTVPRRRTRRGRIAIRRESRTESSCVRQRHTCASELSDVSSFLLTHRIDRHGDHAIDLAGRRSHRPRSPLRARRSVQPRSSRAIFRRSRAIAAPSSQQEQHEVGLWSAASAFQSDRFSTSRQELWHPQVRRSCEDHVAHVHLHALRLHRARRCADSPIQLILSLCRLPGPVHGIDVRDAGHRDELRPAQLDRDRQHRPSRLSVCLATSFRQVL